MPTLTMLALATLAWLPAAQEPEAVVVFPDGSEVACEIADTPLARAIGLSQHTSLEADRGMLFVYGRDQWLSFWMPPSMRFNLDMIFLDGEMRVIHVARDVPPCEDASGWDCPSYGPARLPGRYVVEVVSGTVERIGLVEGDRLEIRFPPSYSPPQWPRRDGSPVSADGS